MTNYLNLMVNTIGRTCVVSKEINKHALSIIITKPDEVFFSIWFLHMLHHKFSTHMNFLVRIQSIGVGEHEKQTK